MVSAGTTCKKCGYKYHNCMSCGNERFMYDYCSQECLEADGKMVCHSCHGWGWDCERVSDNEEEISCPGYTEKKI